MTMRERLQLMPDTVAGESPSELFERMTVMMFQEYEKRIAALEAKVKELAYMVK